MDDKDKDIVARVRHEHERLGEITAALNQALRAGPKENPVAWLTQLRDRFEHFRAHLIHRIALEELGGFLQVVVEREPTLAGEVENLRRDHERIIERAGVTMQRLRALPANSPNSIRDAQVMVEAALAEVQYHENVENLLVSRVFNQDTGGGD